MEQMKKILILTTNNPYKASGVLAYDIFQGFKQLGYTTKLVVESYDNYEEGITCIQNKTDLKFKYLLPKIRNRIRKLKQKYFNIKNRHETFDKYHFDSYLLRDKKYSTKKILKMTGFIPDVIIVIFSQYFISFKNLKELQDLTKAPIFWQFADMFPFTGGCHYSWDCVGYKYFCESCPAYINKKFNNIPNKKLKENLHFMADLNITAVIGSSWLMKRVEESTLFKNKPKSVIYLASDTEFFTPFNQDHIDLIRFKYGFTKKDFVLLIMANQLYDERKGIHLIMEAISNFEKKYCETNNLKLFIIGRGFDKIKEKIPAFLPYVYIETVNRNDLAEIYNISSIFISASLQEMGPYTLIEALLCSIPVVSLSHGYAREFIINDLTGNIIEDDDPKLIYQAILRMIELDIDELNRIKKNCRERTMKIVSKQKIMNDYVELINN